MSETENRLCCPNCGSTELSTDKKGFGAGRFVAGTLLVGPLAGILAGSIGKDKRECYCLQCGNKYKPGTLTTVKKYKQLKAEKDRMKASGEENENVCGGCGIILILIGLVTFIVAIVEQSIGAGLITSGLALIAALLFLSANRMKKKRLEKEKIKALQAEQEAEKKAREAKELKQNERIKEKLSTMTFTCTRCGTEINGAMKFCPNCGNKNEIKGPFFCPQCDAEVPTPNMKFCAQCGADLTSASCDSKNNVTDTTIIPPPIETTIKTEPDTPPASPSLILFIGALLFPYFFIFSKHTSVRNFSIGWLVFFLVIIGINIANTEESAEKPNTPSSPNNAGLHTSSNTVPVRKVATPPPQKKKESAEIDLFHQLPDAVQTELKSIGISEHFGTSLSRRKDLESGPSTRVYKITHCAKLPEACNDSVIIYLKNGRLDDVSYAGRCLYGENTRVHINQAAVDWHCKYKSNYLHEVRDLIQEGYLPSTYAVTPDGFDSR